MLNLLIIWLLNACITSALNLNAKNLKMHSKSSMLLMNMNSPHNPQHRLRTSTLNHLKFAFIATTASLIRPNQAGAIGKLSEFKAQSMIFQDISFNVINTYQVSDFFEAVFPSLCKTIRNVQVGGKNTTVVAFGADAYQSPKTFIPGVSSFYEDGGHATITVEAEELPDNTFALYERGNGLQYIKLGAENLRVSKAIERDAKIKYSYGWIEMDGPSGLPLQAIVGVTRDPIMLVCLRVGDMKSSLAFFKAQLGMRELPFPLARAKGSQFEPPQPKDSVYLSYVEDSLGILLVPSKKGDPPLTIGSELRALTFVVDDSAQPENNVPPAAQEFLNGGPSTISSPDGYPVQFKKYSVFEKYSTKVVTV